MTYREKIRENIRGLMSKEEAFSLMVDFLSVEELQRVFRLLCEYRKTQAEYEHPAGNFKP